MGLFVFVKPFCLCVCVRARVCVCLCMRGMFAYVVKLSTIFPFTLCIIQYNINQLKVDFSLEAPIMLATCLQILWNFMGF